MQRQSMELACFSLGIHIDGWVEAWIDVNSPAPPPLREARIADTLETKLPAYAPANFAEADGRGPR